jgi:hypothetical protein
VFLAIIGSFLESLTMQTLNVHQQHVNVAFGCMYTVCDDALVLRTTVTLQDLGDSRNTGFFPGQSVE